MCTHSRRHSREPQRLDLFCDHPPCPNHQATLSPIPPSRHGKQKPQRSHQTRKRETSLCRILSHPGSLVPRLVSVSGSLDLHIRPWVVESGPFHRKISELWPSASWFTSLLGMGLFSLLTQLFVSQASIRARFCSITLNLEPHPPHIFLASSCLPHHPKPSASLCLLPKPYSCLNHFLARSYLQLLKGFLEILLVKMKMWGERGAMKTCLCVGKGNWICLLALLLAPWPPPLTMGHTETITPELPTPIVTLYLFTLCLDLLALLPQFPW